MKGKYGLLGFIIVFISLFFLKGKWQLYKVEREGAIITMQIKKLPKNCGFTKGKYYADFSNQGTVYNKRIPVGFCGKHKVGDNIEMKYLEGEESILFPNEKVKGDFIAIGIFILVGLVSIIFGIFNKKSK